MLDRYVRMASGVVMLGCAMGMRRRSFLAKSALLGLGALKVSEGATGWCPLVYLSESISQAGSNSNEQSQRHSRNGSADQPQHSTLSTFADVDHGQSNGTKSRAAGSSSVSRSVSRHDDREADRADHDRNSKTDTRHHAHQTERRANDTDRETQPLQ